MDSKENEAALNNNFDESIINYSHNSLKKIKWDSVKQKEAHTLILNDNEIQKIENLESFPNLKRLFIINNHLKNICGLSQLIYLEELDLSGNNIGAIENLKDLKNLRELNLSNNNIKLIEHLIDNTELEKIDLCSNNITFISDISHLKNLKKLFLHDNKITNLRHCEKNLPQSIESITLHNNLISDLNEISHLMQFNSLKELSIANNPCVNLNGESINFNYRPFIKNWCSNLLTLDNMPLDDIECLKAEWLYSQGKGRSFQVGDHKALVEYLVSVCPVKKGNDETDVKKLKLILSKAQHHQKQLKEQLSEENLSYQGAYKSSGKKKVGLSDKMVLSYQDSFVDGNNKKPPEIMSRSLDSGIIRNTISGKGSLGGIHQNPLQTSTTFIPIPDTLISPDCCHFISPVTVSSSKSSSITSKTFKSSSTKSPQSALLENKPVILDPVKYKKGENLEFIKKQEPGSNLCLSTPIHDKNDSYFSTSTRKKEQLIKELKPCEKTLEEKENNKSACNSYWAHHKKIEGKKSYKKNLTNDKNSCQTQEFYYALKGSEKNLEASDVWKAAVCIQRRWRGYRTRNLNSDVLTGCKDIQLNRMQEYILKAIDEMEATRIALEGSRKIQILQMQAINALWKKMTVFQMNENSENSVVSKLTLQELITTCSNLKKEVENLQVMVKKMQGASSTTFQSAPVGTQTELTTTDNSRERLSHPGGENQIFSSTDSSPQKKCEFLNSTSGELKGCVSPVESDVKEIFTNKSLKENIETHLFYR
ncbi:conserved hypothetical protein [Pediculus humanus corporis]|uniref:Centrosomal protein of 97 kDa n=1 Tax=Pediculus humanus subsp. corporis TaxID=121224 RepID=E0W2B2_PEDHC|nr:uncharacterized protein Phum_PHUM588750 [Pediculus humanus corporis]EEB19768.1 conserved hypothetical protein [Pediculus humanus corporis]